jgi:hypothetical protein
VAGHGDGGNRGREVYETYLTHRISDHFIFKAAFIRYNYT